jgi:hypothetical protein
LRGRSLRIRAGGVFLSDLPSSTGAFERDCLLGQENISGILRRVIMGPGKKAVFMPDFAAMIPISGNMILVAATVP